jgi:type I restriction enzyme S subunit
MTKLPDGWEIKRLDEVADVVMGQSPPGSSYNEHGEGQPFFQGKTEFGEVHPTVRKYTTAGTKFAKAGDILMSVRAPVGPTNIADIDCVIGRGLAAIRAKSVVSQSYLRWTLKHLEIDIQSKGTGTTFDAITGETLRGTMIALPPLAEQQEIVEILEDHLSRLDAALTDVKAAKIKAAQFKVAFLRSIFLGRTDWKSIPMKQLGSWGGGGTPSKSNQKYWTNGTVPWLSPKDMGPLEITETEDKITEDAILNSTVKKIPMNSVVFVVRSGILERKLPIAITKIETTLNQDMKAVTFSENVLSKFGFYAMLGLEQDILKKCRKSGTTVASINTESLLNYEIGVPSLPVQEKVLNYVESQMVLIDKTLPQIDLALNFGVSLRRSLLHAAFTGQLSKELVSNVK